MIDLMERKSNGIEVTLYWDQGSEPACLYLEVKDLHNDDDYFIVPVPPDEALEAFQHPYMYKTPSFVPTTDDPDCPTFS